MANFKANFSSLLRLRIAKVIDASHIATPVQLPSSTSWVATCLTKNALGSLSQWDVLSAMVHMPFRSLSRRLKGGSPTTGLKKCQARNLSRDIQLLSILK